MMRSSMSRTWALIGSGLLVAAVLLAALLLPPVQAAMQPDWAAPHVPGQLLVKLPAMAGAASAEAWSARAGLRMLASIPELGLVLVTTPDGADLAATAAEARRNGAEWAEPNYTFALDLAPDDPYYASSQASYLDRMEMPAAWDVTLGREEIVVAVLDTGVQMDHVDLAGAIWVNPGETPGNGVDDDANGFVDDVKGWDFAADDNQPIDEHGHGTHVAGTIAARTNNGIGVAGMAGLTTIMPVDVFEGTIGAYEDLIRAIVYATDNGAHVINMSLGASSYSRGEEMAVDYAWSRGTVVVAAAGNTYNETDHYPAAHVNAIAVAATRSDDTLAPFSTRGSFVDLAAPGYFVLSTYRGNSYAYMNGTSMATPHVSGLAALILARNPRLTPQEVRQILESTADDLGLAGFDIQFGHGRINARAALAATALDPDPFPTRAPTPALDLDLAGCVEGIPDGGFEEGLGGWQASGDVQVDDSRAYAGTQAAHFLGGPDAAAVLTRTVALPPQVHEGFLRLAYRIENTDTGWGSAPSWPYDDWLTAEFRSVEGKSLGYLLRTGNSADTATQGLPWDRYVYRLLVADMSVLREHGAVNLVFTSHNDGDDAPTDFWVDEVSFCVSTLEDGTPTVTPSPTPTATPTATSTPKSRVYVPEISAIVR